MDKLNCLECWNESEYANQKELKLMQYLMEGSINWNLMEEV